ncbi:MAG TPA: hypothetical protein VNB29_03450, partial [Chthoniobacterales bacterium]|nr:hypothetical protein [Chthoniobacterales bacterium]
FEDFAPVRAGIQPENLLHPFNLRGTNPREFGIFLASSYFITNHHDGSLTVRIKEDKSLVFSFFLPCEQAGNLVKKSAQMGDIHKLRGSL